MKAYDVFSATSIGDSHVRRGIPREDNVGEYACDDYQIVVVSDGHGDPNCFRSAKGSEIAVEACIEGLKTFAVQYMADAAFRDRLEIEKYRKEAVLQLITGIEAKWSLMVAADLKNHPIDYSRETEKCDPDKVRLFKEGQRLKTIYGATLLGAVAFDNAILSVQLGDGKCVFLEADGHFSQPMPPDPRCRGNITTSLCDEDAIGSFRSVYRTYFGGEKPMAVILTSDGIEDSYRTDELMYCFHRDVCIQVTGRGLKGSQYYYQNERLAVISKEGSGDDMSVAALVDMSALKPFTSGMQAQNDSMAVQEDARYYLERMQSMENKRKYLKRELDKAEQEMHGATSKLLPNNQVITDYQAKKESCGQQVRDAGQKADAITREMMTTKDAIETLQPKWDTLKGMLERSKKELDDLQNIGGDGELMSQLGKQLDHTVSGEADAEAQQKLRANIEAQIAAKEAEIATFQEDYEKAAEEITALCDKMHQLNGELQSAQAKAAGAKAEITELDQKIEAILEENKQITGTSHSKEQIYLRKKQEWLDYEEKYKAYEAKYNAIIKGM